MVSIKMEIPNEQLNGLGFIEVKEGLFVNDLPGNIKLWRDYRNDTPTSYAYRLDERIPHEFLKQYQAICKIEIRLNGMEQKGLL